MESTNVAKKPELNGVREQHPSIWSTVTDSLTYAEGCKLLREAGIEQDDYEDLSTENCATGTS
jgi:hypothetical protein